ncbi:LysR family transcriptional regulator [Methylovirgula ligni]|uniref:DNA-binding transcriptional LysR family regulator n=1 Tax=Methylovirgula ligni TaxID=569860 RepID=A0A3D9Z3F0_9HYPH|nr:LysR family transcriptional regulator [Methylovirgula ligni]QAY95050.1 LysR family transcriptional regulator [Methylovirgula ligni]REF89672.1 DNA-binding transcriptional LysR family regulator [Methylovirgula ligni]
MDFADLKVFEAVSRLGSMNRAAAELHTVQSNVTARVRGLEEELGIALFQRHARGVTITPAGQRLLPFVGRIAKLFADAEAAAKDEGVPNGALRLGSMETTAALRLSPVLGQFANTYPKVRLVLTTGTTSRLLEDVIEGRVEGAFVAGPVSHPDLHQEVIFHEELVLVTARNVATLGDLTKIADLRTIVFQLGCSYRQRLEAVLADLGIAVAKPMEFGSLDTIISCVAAGVGVTLLPKGVVAAASREGRVGVHELPPKRALVETLLVRRRDAYLSSAMTAFLDLARSHYGVAQTDRSRGESPADFKKIGKKPAGSFSC